MHAKVLKILGRAEVAALEASIKERYGSGVSLRSLFVLRDDLGRVWMASPELAGVDFSKLGVKSIGLFAGDSDRRGNIELSQEAAEFLGIGKG